MRQINRVGQALITFGGPGQGNAAVRATRLEAVRDYDRRAALGTAQHHRPRGRQEPRAQTIHRKSQLVFRTPPDEDGFAGLEVFVPGATPRRPLFGRSRGALPRAGSFREKSIAPRGRLGTGSALGALGRSASPPAARPRRRSSSPRPGTKPRNAFAAADKPPRASPPAAVRRALMTPTGPTSTAPLPDRA